LSSSDVDLLRYCIEVDFLVYFRQSKLRYTLLPILVTK